MTADGTKLVALQTSKRSDLLVSSNPEAGIYKKLVSGTDVKYSLGWTPGGQIVYASNEAGSSDLYVSDPDGARRKQLTFDRKANETGPAASRDGRYIVFASDRTGRLGIQRINADGTGLLSLTSPTAGSGDSNPYVTPDSRWVFYRGWDNGPPLWKLPIDGGTPTLVVGKRSDAREEKAFGVSASPDGTSLAFFYVTLERARREFSATRIAISTLEGRILRELPYASPFSMVGDYQRVQWSRDGSTLYYHQVGIPVGRPDNLWKRSVRGGPPVQVTHFEDRLVDFEWSKDEKLLACSRESRVSDAVLITNFR
jgi:Tol biopolymer transport system component